MRVRFPSGRPQSKCSTTPCSLIGRANEAYDNAEMCEVRGSLVYHTAIAQLVERFPLEKYVVGANPTCVKH